MLAELRINWPKARLQLTCNGLTGGGNIACMAGCFYCKILLVICYGGEKVGDPLQLVACYNINLILVIIVYYTMWP